MKLFRIILVMLLSFFFVVFPIVQAAELALPSDDLVAPVIEHVPIEKNIYSGQPIDIKATVTDNVGVKNVILFYRDVNAAEFKRLKMNRNLDSFIYTAQLAATDSPGLEYYIQATDLAGNTLLFGYPFSPLTIVIAPATEGSLVASGNGDTNVAITTPVIKVGKEKEKSGISKWVWIGLGVVVAGAALSGGGSGGGSTEPPPSTGSLTVLGQVP